MLVLSRKLNERIVIGDNVIVTVVAIQGEHVRLGIQAPREITVHRHEVHEKIKSEAAAKESLEKNILGGS